MSVLSSQVDAGAGEADQARHMPVVDLPSQGTHAFICGLEGTAINDFERGYLREMKPWGVILFARNVESPDRLRRLTTSIRELLGWQTPVLIDQEGGRVQRMKPPHWQRYPAAGRFGAMEAQQPGSGIEAAEIATWLIADDLLSVGIDVNCAPVLDLRVPGGTNAIGNRAFHTKPQTVAQLGRAVHDAYLEAGVVPVIKHVPGHGRAVVDSHEDLPRIATDRQTLESQDFLPFRSLAHAPMAMTGHLVFEAIDAERPTTLSPAMVDVIRSDIGFDGALLTDDLSMGALRDPIADRARGALQAGCDLALHCNGVRTEMEDIQSAIPLLEGRSADRCASALARRGRQSLDRAALENRLSTLLQQVPVDETQIS
ncbi:MAG: beta-N-acetylhexosaminidase [Pseudomonadota bacterium]